MCPECHNLYTLSWLSTQATTTILRGRAGPVVSEAELPEASGGPRTLGFHVAPSPLPLLFLMSFVIGTTLFQVI